MNYEHISRILTLRYDPKTKPGLKPLSKGDFTPKNISNIESKLVEIIKDDLLQRESNLKTISLSLSGGVDSGLTLAMLKKFLPHTKIQCFSMGFGDDDDEVSKAGEIARFYDCDFHSIIKEDILSELPKLISIVKEPRWNLYQFYPMVEGKKKSGVFYSGDGADELFGGYTFRYQKFLSMLKKNTGWKERTKLYLSCHERDWVPDQHKLFGSKIRFSWEKIYNFLRRYFDNDMSPLDQIFLADFNGKLLYDWLPTNDSFGKFLHLDIRSMFLTEKMIKFATHIPWKTKYDQEHAIGKLPLRFILAKQNAFMKIKPIKKGFAVDLSSLWRKNGREIARRYVNSDSEVVKNRIINEKWVTNTHKKLQGDINSLDLQYINKMLGILAVEVWYRLFVSKTMTNDEQL